MMSTVLGFDIGGVNTKAALVRGDVVLDARQEPYEIQRDPDALASLLVRLADRVGAGPSDPCAITMTAELSQLFRTKRDGVTTVLGAVHRAFPTRWVRVYAVDDRLLEIEAALREPLAVAASNWAAMGHVVADVYPDCILLDIGTTTTDIVPIAGGKLMARGWNDPDRLRYGELLYLGALRTPVEAVVHEVPLHGGVASVSAEGFALMGDVHLWRGSLELRDYSVATPDGRPATRQFAGERIARIVCADRDLLDEPAISAIADFVADIQVTRIASALARVRGHHPAIETAVITGLGDFIAESAARAVGLQIQRLADFLGPDAAHCAPAAAVALRLAAVLAEMATATR